MYFIGEERYIEFRVSDDSENPITGLILSNFTVIFTRDSVSCSDALTLVENGGGLYTLNYTPSATGHDYLDLYIAAYDQRIQDSDDVYTSNIFEETSGSEPYSITQDTGGTNALKLITTNPQNYVIYVFQSSLWIAGSQTPNYSSGDTNVDTAGNWLNSITVAPDTYHVVAIWNTNQIVLAAYLIVD